MKTSYLQLKEGAIRICLTEEVARVHMDRWSSLSRSNVELYLLCKYVDDIDIAAGLVEERMKWRGIGEERRLEKGEVREVVGESAEIRTMRLIVEESSKLVPEIKFS